LKTGQWVLVAGLFLGCAGSGAATEPKGRLEIRMLTHDEQAPRYALYVPARAPGGPRPPIFSWYGGRVTLECQTGLSGRKSPFKLWVD